MTEAVAPKSNGGEQAALKLRQYTYRALTCKGSDNTAYNEFLRELSKLRKRNEREPTEASHLMMANLILALRDCVSVIKERKHDKILAEVLGVHLWTSAKVVQDALIELVTSLVVANSAFTHTCLQVLVFAFLPAAGPPVPGMDGEGNGPWAPPEEMLEAQTVVLEAVEKVMRLVPTAPAHLLSLVVQNMPHKLRDRNTQCLFLRAVFKVAEAKGGAPIRDGLLAAVVEHLLGLDVEIKWEDIVDNPTGEEEEEEEAEEGACESDEEPDMFELEGMNEADLHLTPEELEQRHQLMALQKQEKEQAGRGGWEGAAAAGAEVTTPREGTNMAEEPEAATVDLAANKLDSMMELVFAHIEARANTSEHHMALWDVLVGIFDRCILNTHRSKFTQYLIFFACMKHRKTYSKAFIDFLITRLKDSQHPVIARSACAAYLASFLARAAFIPEALVVSALSQLTDFCHEYALSVSSGGAPPAASQLYYTPSHQVFYASIQAILYALCYHMETLMGAAHPLTANTKPVPGDAKPTLGAPKAMMQAKTVASLVRERLMPLLAHPKLAPLNVCLPSVVTEFKNQASALGLLDLSTLLPSDEVLRRSQRPLEMFFPFDPYLLQRSSRFLCLKTSYVRWRHGHPASAIATGVGAGAAAAEDDDNDDDDDDDDDDSSDNSSEDDQNVDELDDELDGLSLDGDVRSDDGSDPTSGDSDTESGDVLGHGPGDVLMPTPLGVLGMPRRKPVYRLNGRPPLGNMDMKMRNGRGIYAGSKHGRSVDDDGRSVLLSVMGTSYSPNTSSMGDVTPTGTSPVLVDYAYPGSLTNRSHGHMGLSMSVTPPTGAVPASIIGQSRR